MPVDDFLHDGEAQARAFSWRPGDPIEPLETLLRSAAGMPGPVSSTLR